MVYLFAMTQPPEQTNRSMTQGVRAFYLLSLGCAKNQVESEHLAGLLLEAGWRARTEPAEADVLVVNTCGFIEEAVQENIEAILELAASKRPEQRLAVVGCLVGRYGKKLAASLSEADLLVAPGEVHRIDEILAGDHDRLYISRPTRVFGAADSRALSTGPGWAYLRVSDGCDRRCAFCTIGAIRGPHRSRPMHDVLQEAERLAGSGVRELNLVAQDLLAYGSDLPGRTGLGDLLQGLCDIRGLEWIRTLYLHPDYFNEDTIRAMLDRTKVLPYFDLPLQHVDDGVLKAMGRRRGGAELIDLLDRIRRLSPAATLRATLMTGHPGEGPRQFERLREFVASGRLDHLGCFAYSPESGTRSAKMEAPAREEAEARRDELMALHQGISAAKLREQVGREQDLLVLGPHPESDLLGQGRLASQAPEVDGSVIITDGQAAPGELARCRITKSHAYDLEAVIIN